jgi:ubiquinone/menaquinone biosynthesis C-methylase UbiE
VDIFKSEPGSQPSVRYFLANAGDYSREVPDDYFDVVYSVSVLEHVPADRMRDVFMDMIRVTKPGGLLLHNV